jgi:deoxyribonuclease V
MIIPPLHCWDFSPKEAIKVQERLSTRIIRKGRLGKVRYVAGADVAFSKTPPLAYAGVIVMTFPDLVVVETQQTVSELDFPYIPGLLSFRESPALLRTFEKLRLKPDLVLIDGQGVAHPRGIGLASHIGLWLDTPTIGCAKSVLFGKCRSPGPERGNWVPLTDTRDRVIGAAVRTRDKTNPIYVSIGHKINLLSAIRYALACARGYRIPEPTRQADAFVGRLKREHQIGNN